MYIHLNKLFCLAESIPLWRWRKQSGENKMDKWINLSKRKWPTWEIEGGLRRKEAKCHTWMGVVKTQQTRGISELHARQAVEQDLQRPGRTPEHAGSRAGPETQPLKCQQSPSPHSYRALACRRATSSLSSAHLTSICKQLRPRHHILWQHLDILDGASLTVFTLP